MSLRAIWTAFIDDGDTNKAVAALVKAKRNYDVGVLAEVYKEKLEAYKPAKDRQKVKRFLAKHNVSLEG